MLIQHLYIWKTVRPTTVTTLTHSSHLWFKLLKTCCKTLRNLLAYENTWRYETVYGYLSVWVVGKLADKELRYGEQSPTDVIITDTHKGDADDALIDATTIRQSSLTEARRLGLKNKHTHTHTHTASTQTLKQWRKLRMESGENREQKLEDVPLVEFMYLVLTHTPGKRQHRQLGSLLVYLCDFFQALINSLVCL